MSIPDDPTVRNDDATVRVAPASHGAPARSPMPVTRYELGPELGRGGMGQVVRARDPALGRQVALKRIAGGSPDLAAQFVAEAQVTAQLDHPGIVPVYELAADAAGEPYYTMKEVKGRTLAEVVGEGAIPLPQLLRIFQKICDAVAFAHSRGVIHRDLKPANVMTGEFGEVLVMDWGLACRAGSGERGVAGTPAYLSPEQAGGETPADEQSDQYLLGGILYEILTGTPPHRHPEGEGLSALLERIQREPVEPPPRRAPGRAIPPELEAIALKALERDPARRYPDVPALRADVEAYLDGRLVGAARYTLAAAARKWLARHRYLVRSVAAVLVCLVGFGVYLTYERAARRAKLARQREEARQRHEQEVRRARERVAAWNPAALLKSAELESAAIPASPVERTPLALPHKERLAKLLRDLGELARAQAELVALAPAHRRELLATHLAMGRLAERGEDFTLAEMAYDQAGRSDLRKGVMAARLGRVERERRGAEELLTRAEKGDLEEPESFRVAVIELASFRGRHTVDVLLRRLDALTKALERAALRTIEAAGQPFPQEAAGGWKPIPGLAEAGKAWLASRNCTPEGAVKLALERLELRAAREPPRPTWRTLLAAAQEAELARSGHGKTVLHLACEGLGSLGDPRDVVAALERYLWTEWDELRAVPAGHALMRLKEHAPEAGQALARLVGLAAATGHERRWTHNGPWWVQVSRLRAWPTRNAAKSGSAARSAPVEPRTAREFNARGMLRESWGDRDGAMADYRQAIKLDPRFAGAYNNRGRARERKGDLGAAIADYSEAIRLEPRHAIPYNNRGLARARRGDLYGAITDFNEAIRLEPGNAAAYNNRGNARETKGDLNGAIADFTEAIRLDAKVATAYNNRGYARQRKGDLDGAIADYNEAIRLDPRDATACNNRGHARRRTGNLDGAIADYTQAIQIDPTQAVPYRNRADARAGSGDLDGAIADYNEAIRRHPSDATAYHNRGWARERKGDLDGAIADYTHAIRLAPKDATTYNNRGVAHKRRGDLDRAIADYTEAIRLNPRYPDAYDNRGLARASKGELDGAMADHDEAIRLDPRNGAGYNNRANARSQKGDWDGAIADLTEAIRLDPKDARAYTNRGLCRQKRGNLGHAISDFNEAIGIDRRYAFAYSGRGFARYQKGDLDGGIADLTEAVRLAPSDPLSWKVLGLLRTKKGDRAGAIEAWEREHALAPPADRPAIAKRLDALRRGE